MSEQESPQQASPQPPESDEEPQGRVDAVAVLYILGGIPAIVAFIVGLFTLVNFFRQIPA